MSFPLCGNSKECWRVVKQSFPDGGRIVDERGVPPGRKTTPIKNDKKGATPAGYALLVEAGGLPALITQARCEQLPGDDPTTIALTAAVTLGEYLVARDETNRDHEDK
jgi:hypothetical protein